jgi:hypothetical protein
MEKRKKKEDMIGALTGKSQEAFYKALNESYDKAPNLPDANIYEAPVQHYAETYPKGERDSPDPLRNTIKVSPGGHDHDQLVSLLTGERMHLGNQDQAYADLRQKFSETLDPDQEQWMKNRYKRSGDKRDYDKWRNVSGLDSLIRDGLLPNLPSPDRPEDRQRFRDKFYTSDNKAALKAMSDYISQKVEPYE